MNGETGTGGNGAPSAVMSAGVVAAAWACAAALLGFAVVKVVTEVPADAVLSRAVVHTAAAAEVVCAGLLLARRTRFAGWLLLTGLCLAGCLVIVFSWNDARPCGCTGGFQMSRLLRLGVVCLGGVVSCWAVGVLHGQGAGALVDAERPASTS